MLMVKSNKVYLRNIYVNIANKSYLSYVNANNAHIQA